MRKEKQTFGRPRVAERMGGVAASMVLNATGACVRGSWFHGLFVFRGRLPRVIFPRRRYGSGGGSNSAPVDAVHEGTMVMLASRHAMWFRHRLDIPSHAKYLVWRALSRLGRSGEGVVVSLKDGPRLLLRGPPARDLDTAYELFQGEVYRIAVDRARDVRLVVDLGANAGYSLTYLAWHFPEARFIAFEPNPSLLRALYRNIQLNALEGRVTVHPSAASTQRGELQLTDEESESSLRVRPGVRTINVSGEDLFESLRGLPVDLLKMDIEGAEYSLLSDPRFATLRPRAIVMEWHSTDEHPDGKRWCIDSLRQLGYTVDAYLELSATTGMIYAGLS